VVLVGLLFWKRREFRLSQVLALLDPRGRWGLFARGILTSIIFSAALVPAFIFLGDLSLSIRDADYYLTRIPKILLGAIITAFIEEFLFRGILFSEFRTRFRLSIAVGLSTIIYAAVHFIAPVKSWVYSGGVFSGFSYLSVLFEGMLNLQHFAPFIGLCFVGLVLIRAYVITGSLVVSVGLHAGWILAVKTVFHLTALNPDLQSGLAPLATRYFLVSHPVGWLAVIIVGLILPYIFKKKA